MTPLQWLEREQGKAASIDAELIPGIMKEEVHFAVLLLSIIDGMRSLTSHCLAVDGLLFTLSE